MVDMTKVQPNIGYATPKPTYGQSYAPQPAVQSPAAGQYGAAYQTQPPHAQVAAQAVPAATPAGAANGQQSPYGKDLWTPQQWNQAGQYYSAGLSNPYQQAQGLTDAQTQLQKLYASGGDPTDVSAIRQANDALYNQQSNSLRQSIMQQMHASGYGDSSVLGSQLMNQLGNLNLQRDLNYANLGYNAREAAAGRLSSGISQGTQLGGQQGQDYANWINQGMGFAQGLNNVGTEYWNAPQQYYQNMVLPGQQMYNQQLTAGAYPTQYQPGLASQSFGMAGAMLPYMSGYNPAQNATPMPNNMIPAGADQLQGIK